MEELCTVNYLNYFTIHKNLEDIFETFSLLGNANGYVHFADVTASALDYQDVYPKVNVW